MKWQLRYRPTFYGPSVQRIPCKHVNVFLSPYEYTLTFLALTSRLLLFLQRLMSFRD